MGSLAWLGYLSHTQVVESSNLSPSTRSYAFLKRNRWLYYDVVKECWAQTGKGKEWTDLVNRLSQTKSVSLSWHHSRAIQFVQLYDNSLHDQLGSFVTKQLFEAAPYFI